MSRRPSRVVLRSGILVCSAGILTGGLAMLLGGELMRVAGQAGLPALGGPDARDPVAFDELLTVLSSAVLLGCAAWLFVVSCLVSLESVLGALAPEPGTSAAARVTRWGQRLCPERIHRLLLAGCGAVLVTGLVAPTAAADPPGAGQATARVLGATVTGLAVPDRTAGSVPPRGTQQPSANPPPTVLVAAGDSLWFLARQSIGGRPTDAQVAAAWRGIYRANHDRIGDDPDLIFPGTALKIPDPDRSQRKEPS